MRKSKYQLAVEDTYINTDKNICINAVAGSGKTTTLLILLEVARGSSIFMAFNKSIVNELKDRIPKNPLIEIATSHSIGIKALGGYYRKKLDVRTNKYWKICETLNDSKWKLGKKKFIKTAFQVCKLYDVYRLNLCKNHDEVKKYADSMGVDWTPKNLKYLDDLCYSGEIYNKMPNEVDFVDMIYLPCVLPKFFLPTPQNLFVDEVQDFNRCQFRMMEMMMKKSYSKFVAVGDPKQCQPIGTKVKMWNGQDSNIEDIKVGDCLLTYDPKAMGGITSYYSTKQRLDYYKSRGVTNIVEDIAVRSYTGNLHIVQTDTSTSKYTHDHICMTTFNNKQGYIIYLMRKGDYFRLGKSKLKSNRSNGFRQRMQGEKADAIWILQVFETDEQARFAEQKYSFLYQIPQMVFRYHNQKSGMWNQENVNRFWIEYSNEIDLTDQANRLLKLFNREIDYPFFEKGVDIAKYRGRKNFFEVRACNLLPGYMELGECHHEFDGSDRRLNRKSFQLSIDSVINLSTYSIQVSNYSKTYIADNILTHNCIYGFAGADSNSFKRVSEFPNTIQLPLSVCYRCDQSIVKFAQRYNPAIMPFEQKPIGVVRTGIVHEAKERDMIICRNLKPLVDAFFELIDDDKKAFIKGKDLGKGLIELIKLTRCNLSSELVQELRGLIQAKKLQLENQGIENPAKHPQFINLVEKVSIVLKLSLKFKQVNEIISFIERIFKDNDSQNSIVLSTIHKAKGLEADNVFFLDRHLIPSKFATSEDQKKQENNIFYVGVTRAKKQLIFINSIQSTQDEYIESFEAQWADGGNVLRQNSPATESTSSGTTPIITANQRNISGSEDRRRSLRFY